MNILLPGRVGHAGAIAVAALALCSALIARAQDSSSPSLGDLARKTRQEHAAPGHAAGRQLVNEEEDGPDTTGTWRVQLCSRTPCYELSITLPKEPKWTRGKAEPRPVLIPLPGSEADPARIIRVYPAESLGHMYVTPDIAKRLFLQDWFAHPEYFGQPARILFDEHVTIDSSSGLVSHFTIVSDTAKYRGLSVIANNPNGNSGFACVYREADAAAAGSICDAIAKSAHSQALEPGKRPVYPKYLPPPVYYPQGDDPPQDPPDDIDP